jgi:hypothetical protein
MAVGGDGLSGFDHPFWRSRQFSGQSATDVRGSMVVRVVVLVFMAESDAAAETASVKIFSGAPLLPQARHAL